MENRIEERVHPKW